MGFPESGTAVIAGSLKSIGVPKSFAKKPHIPALVLTTLKNRDNSSQTVLWGSPQPGVRLDKSYICVAADLRQQAKPLPYQCPT